MLHAAAPALLPARARTLPKISRGSPRPPRRPGLPAARMTSIARRNSTAERQKAQEKAEAEAALDAILDDAIAEFEEEEDLSQKVEDAGSDDKVASLLSGASSAFYR